jgi:hypothetical protein
VARRFFRSTSSRSRRDERPAETPAKVGLLAMLVPSLVAVIQSLAAAKMSGAGAQSAATSPQAWMVNTLWGMARNRFRKRPAAAAGKTAGPADGLKTVGSRTPPAEPLRERRFKPR